MTLTGLRSVTGRRWLGLLVCGAVQVSLAQAARPRVVPAPQQIQWVEAPPLSLPLERVAIVVGERATLPEHHAAERLRDRVARRFGRDLPVLAEQQDPTAHEVVVLLGQRTSHTELDRLCREHRIELSEASPGHDGYVIASIDDGPRRVVLVGGSNPRGVIYGQDTLFQLLEMHDGDLTLHLARIRDRPVVPWRGRPQTSLANYFRPGELDAYLTARINFVDLREGIYAFDPGADLDEAIISRVLDAAHQRGLIVYGTVNCGVARSQHDAVLGMFERFLALGADGVWLSFDDKGPGEAPEQLITRVLALGKDTDATRLPVAITPPKGSYQEILTDFNRKIMAIDGMENALWLWTRVPSEQDLSDARAIGLRRKPGWWHNWPRLTSSHRYIPPPPMSVGWHAPSWETLSRRGPYAEAVMPWGGSGWGVHYIVPVIGWWAWNPAKHDWATTRGRMYDIVFGPGQVAAARAFDDALTQLNARLRFSTTASRWQPFCPPRLHQLEDRPRGSSLIDTMGRQLTKLRAASADHTLLGADALETRYLDRMTAELAAVTASVRLPFPEYWWEPHQRQILTALYDDDVERAGDLIAAGRTRVLQEIDQVSQAAGELRRTEPYVQWWTDRARLDVSGWQDLIRQRRLDLEDRLKEYGYYVIKLATMLQGMKEPPWDWGTGRWQVANEVLATVSPTDQEQAWGKWIGGLFRYGKSDVAVFAAKRKVFASAGEFSELPVRIPLSGRRDRLGLLLFVSNVNKETIGGHYVRARWARHRFVTLIWRDEVIWEADVGIPREQGEWFMAELPPLPDDLATLDLRLRVEDRRPSTKNYTLVFVSPLRLIQLP